MAIEDRVDTPLLRTLWAAYYPAKKETIKAALEAAGYEFDGATPVSILWTKDNEAAILYHGDTPCALVTIDYSEPELKITYVNQ